MNKDEYDFWVGKYAAQNRRQFREELFIKAVLGAVLLAVVFVTVCELIK